LEVSQSNEVSLRGLVFETELTSDYYHQVRVGVTSRRSSSEELEELLQETDDIVRRSAVLDLLGRRDEARSLLEANRSEPFAVHLDGKLLLEEGRSAEALEVLTEGWQAHGSIVPAIGTLLCEAKIRTGDIEGAKKLLSSFSFAPDHPRGQYLDGLLHEHEGDYSAALLCYEKATSGAPEETRFWFRFGYLNALYGDEETAVRAYEMCQRTAPIYTHAMLNLGLLYEDAERYSDAITCYRMVIQSNPHHRRARMYLKDAEASLDMYYDKEKEKENSRRQQLLQIPVTEFELSVRSRNCLQKMNIHTLGDLIEKSETELLAYKNFGETSLAEIRKILTQKNLRLGEGVRSDDRNVLLVDSEQSAILSEPVSTLELSSRSQRCMDRLGIESLGDLVRRTELELVSQKNFGVTSLHEVKRKLKECNLTLAGG